MRALLQRVSHAAVEVDGQTVGKIGLGWLVLVGVGQADTPDVADQLADKIALLRCFEDAQGKTNLSVVDVGGAILLVSQFTLYADTSRGRRPSFIRSGDPKQAEALYEQFAALLEETHGIPTRKGSFGAHMTVSIENDGPVTLALSTDDWATNV